MRKDFNTFKSGDVVRIKQNFPYINRELLYGEIYTIDKMLGDAGVVTLVGQPSNKTFPDEAFELIYNGELSGKE